MGVSSEVTFAYGAMKSNAVICKRNLRVLVKRPKHVPKLSNSFRGKLLAYLIIASLERKSRIEYRRVEINPTCNRKHVHDVIEMCRDHLDVRVTYEYYRQY